MDDEATTFPLDESDLPTHWVNIAPDLPEPPLPPLHPGTLQPAGPDDLADPLGGLAHPPDRVARTLHGAQGATRSPAISPTRISARPSSTGRCKISEGWTSS